MNILKKDFDDLFIVKSSGCKMFIVFAGTLTRQMLYSLRMLTTASVIWPRNTLMMSLIEFKGFENDTLTRQK